MDEAPLFLSMHLWLNVVGEYGMDARDKLIEDGFHPKVIYAKAEKSARKGYTNFGTVADRCWLTDAGRVYLAQNALPAVAS